MFLSVQLHCSPRLTDDTLQVAPVWLLQGLWPHVTTSQEVTRLYCRRQLCLVGVSQRRPASHGGYDFTGAMTSPGGHDVSWRLRCLTDVTTPHGRYDALRRSRRLMDVTTPHGRHDVFRMSRCLLYFATTALPSAPGRRRSSAAPAAAAFWCTAYASGFQGRLPLWTADADLRPCRRHDMT